MDCAMQAEPGSALIRLVVPSHPLAVRAALATLLSRRHIPDLPEAERESAEIVLAEVLNNVAEHAYAGQVGSIEVTIRVQDGSIACLIVDHGQCMPDDRLPAGLVPVLGPTADLPEGGFGWHLIRTLTDDLDYRRIDDRNELRFSLKFGQ
jgi:serine/threonine-protein kinase RsbW